MYDYADRGRVKQITVIKPVVRSPLNGYVAFYCVKARKMSSKTKVNPDLQRERDKCSFNITELTNLLDGGAAMTEERRRRGNYSSIFFATLSCLPTRKVGVRISLQVSVRHF